MEKFIKTRFDGSDKSNVVSSSTPFGGTIMNQLGVSNLVDYTKPLLDPHTALLLSALRGHRSSENLPSQIS